VKYEEQDMQQAFMVNVYGTSHLILAAKAIGVSRFIHIGSCFEYGNKDHAIHENEVLEPTSLYGVSKASGTLLALVSSKQNHIPLVAVRLFGLWGSLEGKDRLVPQVIDHCLTGTRLKLTGCEQIRDYLPVEDAAAMLADLVEIPQFTPYEVVNLASGIPIKLRDFVTEIASLFHREDLMLFGELPYRSTEMWHLVGNVERWKTRVGKIRQSSISEGVKKMLEADHVRYEIH
jgi:dTDP-6-deoxy-L-talose 4-dehydrogenase (NAD+)